MRRRLAFLLPIMILVAGCATSSQVRVERYMDQTLPPTAGPVTVHANEDAIGRDYEELARLTMEGSSDDRARSTEAFVAKARGLGANAIVLQQADKKVIMDAKGYRETTLFSAIAVRYTE